MSDILIRNVRPELKREIEERARANKRSLSREIEALLATGVGHTARADRAWPGNRTCRKFVPRNIGSDDFRSSRAIDPERPPPDFSE